MTCAGFPGSEGNAVSDVEQLVDWGVDFWYVRCIACLLARQMNDIKSCMSGQETRLGHGGRAGHSPGGVRGAQPGVVSALHQNSTGSST
jgi:hypothetical protein